MAKVVVINGKKYWSDFKENLTSVENILDEDKARDKVVEACCSRAIKLNKQLVEAKKKIIRRVSEYLNSVAEKHGANWKGNTIIVNFGQYYRVIVKVQNFISFDEKLNIAKSKIMECLDEWSSDSNPALIALVDKAFETDRKGKINREFVFKLTRMKMKPKTCKEKWEEAMQLLRDSMFVESSKDYYTFQYRGDDDKWETILLDFAAL